MQSFDANQPRNNVDNVYVMRRDKAEENRNAVTDTFVVQCCPITMLFTCGAIESFISSKITKKLKLESYLGTSMLSVAIPIGDSVRCGKLFKGCPILIAN